MSKELKVGDKFVIEIAEIYCPQDEENHPTNACKEIYRIKGNIPLLQPGQLSSIPRLDDVIAKKTKEKPIKWVTIKEGYPSKNGIYIVHTTADNYFSCEYEVDNTFTFYNGTKVRDVDAWLDFPEFKE